MAEPVKPPPPIPHASYNALTQQPQTLQVFAHYKALAAQAETDTAFVDSCHKGAGALLPELRLPRVLEDLAGLRGVDIMGDQQEPAAWLTELLQQQLYDNAEYLVATYQVCLLCILLVALVCVPSLMPVR